MEALVAERKGELVKKVARRIVADSPRLADLGAEELEKLARVVVVETLRDELKAAVTREKIDYQDELGRFLQRASRTGSAHTRRAYQAALGRLEAWTAGQRISPLELTPALADDWIEAEKAEGRAPSSIRLTVAGASTFFTWLERRHAEVKNPFRGSKARPAGKPRRKLAVPSLAEIAKLENAARPELRAAIVTMAELGLRVGGLPGLSVYGERFATTTKGKERGGRLPEKVREEIERAGLSLRAPFAAMSAQKIADRFRLLVGRLHVAGKLRERYSVHDLRHAFAVRLYESTHDVYAVKQALGHANVAVTETYLRSLGLE